MVNKGVNRFNSTQGKLKQKGNGSNTSSALILIKRGIEPLAQAIDKWKKKIEEGKAKKKADAYRFLVQLPSDKEAFIALKTIFDILSKDPQSVFQNIARQVGSNIEFEIKSRELKEKDSSAFNLARWQIKHNTIQQNFMKKRVYQNAFKKSEMLDYDPSPASVLVRAGGVLIGLVIDTLGLFFAELSPIAKRNGKLSQHYYLRPTAKTEAWIREKDTRMALMTPYYLPTLVPPKRWSWSTGGGYYNSEKIVLKLVKTVSSKHMSLIEEAIESGQMNDVLDGVNILQETPWRLNKTVYETVKALWNNAKGNVAGLPSNEDFRCPPCPICGQDITETVEARIPHPCLTELKAKKDPIFTDWVRRNYDARMANVSNFGKRLNVMKTLAAAKEVEEFDQFYFPYQLDFRGRIYAVPPFLNPQGTQIAKGMLEFAEGKALGDEEAVKWLAIHGANTYGEDKVSFEDRLAFVREHEKDILASAEDPLENRWWMDADEPFPFLAFCLEWAGYKREGLDYVSHLPVAMDGSCNGLQIFSLLLRDAVGGHAVNLTPEKEPQDIYRIVADRVREAVEKDASDPVGRIEKTKDGKELFNVKDAAQVFLDMGIDRKTTKRQSMVLAYGETFMSCLDYTREWINVQLAKGFQYDKSKIADIQRAAPYLASLIWKALAEIVVSAKEGMNFLKNVAKAIATPDRPVRWTAPSGFPAFQDYKTWKKNTVKLTLGDSATIFSVVQSAGDDFDVKKSVQAFAPNYVHSLDASALIKTIMASKDLGIANFAMIHDSYGTHACDSASLAKVLREVFVEMFSAGRDPLGDLLREARGEDLALTEEEKDKLPEEPEKGSLNVEEVRQSKFFFA